MNQVIDERPANTGIATVVYVLYLVTLISGVTAIIGVVMAYMYRDEAPEWLRTHYEMQIRTFWIGLLWVGLCMLFVVMTLGLGILIAWFPLLIVSVWFVYRVARGWIRLREGRPMYA